MALGHCPFFMVQPIRTNTLHIAPTVSPDTENTLKLLLVEDDLQIGEGLQLGLSSTGFQVDWVQRGSDALAARNQTRYDLLVLDLGLPDMDGLDVLRQLQRLPEHPPTLILSARHLTADRIKGLNLGADDYLVKPFDFDELLARLHALHRRSQGRREPVLNLGALQVDPLRRSARLQQSELALSPREFDVLLALAEKPGAVRSIDWLQSRLYRWGEEAASNAIQVHLHHLRKKMGEGWIHNIRGVGYKLEAPPHPTPGATP
jgi:two-component system response regulator QseB